MDLIKRHQHNYKPLTFDTVMTISCEGEALLLRITHPPYVRIWRQDFYIIYVKRVCASIKFTGVLMLNSQFFYFIPITLTLLTDCAQDTQLQPPNAHIPIHFSNNSIAGELPAKKNSWAEVFIDKGLRQLIKIAIENNTDISISNAQVDLAKIAYYRETRRKQPTVDLSTTSAYTKTRSSSYHNSSTSVLQITEWELDLVGRIDAASEKAKAELIASEAFKQATVLLIITEVANNWLNFYANTRRLELASRTLASREQALGNMLKRVEFGIASHLDLAQLQTIVESARYDVLKYTVEQSNSLSALMLITGLQNSEAVAKLAYSASPKIALASIPENLSSDVLLKRPDVIAVEQQLSASQANVELARAAMFPQITLTAQTGTSSNALLSLFNHGIAIWSFIPKLTIPLFNKHALEADVEEALVNQRLALNNYEKVLQIAFNEVLQELNIKNKIVEQVETQQNLVVAAQRLYVLAEERYRRGISGHLELLDAQRSLYVAEQGKISEELNESLNRVQLYKVFGGF